jgi:hypothetical protein
MGWLDKLEQEAHWIPVTERLPKENYLDDGYLTRQAIQSLSENYAKSQLALWYQQEKNRCSS